MTAKIEVKNLIKSFHDTVAVNNVSFTVQSAEVFVIMGLSGSGKSTILRCLNRLIEPDSGEIFLDGHDIIKLSASQLRLVRQKKMSMVFQQFALLPHRTVLQNAAYGLEVQGVAKDKREESPKMFGYGWISRMGRGVSGQS